MSDTHDSATVQALRRGYDAIARRDFDAIAELLDPEFEARDRPESPDPGTYRGQTGARSAMDATFDYFDDVEMVAEEFHERGDMVVVVVTLRGRGRGSGVPVEQRLAHLWRMRDGRGYRLQAYTLPEDALREAGIEAGQR